MTEQYSKYVAIIHFMSFVDLLAVGLTFPLLYPHLKSIGASTYAIGLFGSAYSGVQIFSGPLIGSWSDVRGCKSVLFITLFIGSCCYLLCGLTNSLLVLFALRLLLGLTKHTQTLCKVLILDLIPKDSYSKVFAQSVSIGSLGFVIGPMIGGHLIMLDNGFTYVCLLTSILFLINLGLVFHIPRSSRQNKAKNLGLRTEFHKMFLELTSLDWKNYWDVFLLRFLYGLSISIFFSNQSLFMEEKFNVTKVVIGYTISFLSGIGVIAGFLVRKGDNVNLINYSYLFFTLTLFCLNFATNVYVYVILLMPLAATSTFLRISTTELILLKSKNLDQKGSLSGVSNSLMSISRFISPLTIGLSNNLILNQNIAPVIAFVPSFIACLLCMKIVNKDSIFKNKNV